MGEKVNAVAASAVGAIARLLVSLTAFVLLIPSIAQSAETSDAVDVGAASGTLPADVRLSRHVVVRKAKRAPASRYATRVRYDSLRPSVRSCENEPSRMLRITFCGIERSGNPLMIAATPFSS